jgi:hypothetical protein
MLNSLAADAALFHAEAHLKWLEHCRAVLQSWHPESLGNGPGLPRPASTAESKPAPDKIAGARSRRPR